MSLKIDKIRTPLLNYDYGVTISSKNQVYLTIIYSKSNRISNVIENIRTYEFTTKNGYSINQIENIVKNALNASLNSNVIISFDKTLGKIVLKYNGNIEVLYGRYY